MSIIALLEGKQGRTIRQAYGSDRTYSVLIVDHTGVAVDLEAVGVTAVEVDVHLSPNTSGNVKTEVPVLTKTITPVVGEKGRGTFSLNVADFDIPSTANKLHLGITYGFWCKYTESGNITEVTAPSYAQVV